jgi:hypothetical protein
LKTSIVVACGSNSTSRRGALALIPSCSRYAASSSAEVWSPVPETTHTVARSSATFARSASMTGSMMKAFATISRMRSTFGVMM